MNASLNIVGQLPIELVSYLFEIDNFNVGFSVWNGTADIRQGSGDVNENTPYQPKTLTYMQVAQLRVRNSLHRGVKQQLY